MQACDKGSPPRCEVAVVRVRVNRNFQDPKWDQGRYEATIDEGTILGTSVLSVNAKDEDRRVCLLFVNNGFFFAWNNTIDTLVVLFTF